MMNPGKDRRSAEGSTSSHKQFKTRVAMLEHEVLELKRTVKTLETKQAESDRVYGHVLERQRELENELRASIMRFTGGTA